MRKKPKSACGAKNDAHYGDRNWCRGYAGNRVVSDHANPDGLAVNTVLQGTFTQGTGMIANIEQIFFAAGLLIIAIWIGWALIGRFWPSVAQSPTGSIVDKGVDATKATAVTLAILGILEDDPIAVSADGRAACKLIIDLEWNHVYQKRIDAIVAPATTADTATAATSTALDAIMAKVAALQASIMQPATPPATLATPATLTPTAEAAT